MDNPDIATFLFEEGYNYTIGIDNSNVEEASDWCREFLGENFEWIEIVNDFYFRDKETFVWFKLTWK